jgi:hypothetical protein
MLVARFRDDLDMVTPDASFLAQFAQSGCLLILAIVDAALRHLPSLDFAVDPLSDEDLPIHVDEHHTDARPVSKLRIIWH